MMDASIIGTARREEATEKEARIRAFMGRNQLDALIIARQNNFAWATGGGSNWVGIASDLGAASLVYTSAGKNYAVLDNIEAPRYEAEEGLKELGFEIAARPWWDSADNKRLRLLEVAGGLKKSIGADYDMEGAFNVAPALGRERWSLTPQECERYREVGRLAAEALETVAVGLEPGLTEWEIAGRLAHACYNRGLIPFVTLVATDERIYQHRHPIPTMKNLEKYAMLVLCAKRGGLIANCTRQIHFGPLSSDLAERHIAVQRVDAAFNLATKPGVVVSDIFAQALAEYNAAGFPDEWRLHHQGGATGYEARDYFGTPGNTEKVLDWQAFAWNPSITGTKCEDTILVSQQNGLEILTAPSGSNWPKTLVEIEGAGSMPRPDILVM